MRLVEIWRSVTATHYTRVLEAEVVRLRAENRALLNSILGIAGVPPIPVEAASVGRLGVPALNDASAANADGSSLTRGAHSRRVQGASPMRRRSWQQINRALEFASARRKEKPGDLPEIPRTGKVSAS